jgi:lipoate-protein ligase B
MNLIHPEGQIAYAEGLQLQQTCSEALQQGCCGNSLILLEHKPVITLGRNAAASGVVVPTELLDTLGIEVHRIGRGGEATYHGPGQIVGYPILNLRSLKLGVRQYVELLEEVMIQTARKFQVDAYRVAGRQGIFCQQGKLGAVGVAVSRGITSHGFALNVCPDLSHFNFIVPCGLTDVMPTSLAAVLGRSPELEDVRQSILDVFAELFNIDHWSCEAAVSRLAVR